MVLFLYVRWQNEKKPESNTMGVFEILILLYMEHFALRNYLVSLKVFNSSIFSTYSKSKGKGNA